MKNLLQELSENLIGGKKEVVEELTRQTLQNGTEARDILNKGLLPGMEVVGQKFRDFEFFLPEVLVAARAMKAAMEIIKPILVETGVRPVAKVVLGTVRGDLHDIGKNLVGMMLQGAGFEVIDLGIDVTPEKFVEMARQHQVELVGLSALLTTTMVSMKDTVQAFRDAGYRDRVKIMIGGAPVTEEYAIEIGADGYASDAPSATELAKSLLKS
jgi:5-methyltetrahydrofolate--homocysteine methyltransferase